MSRSFDRCWSAILNFSVLFDRSELSRLTFGLWDSIDEGGGGCALCLIAVAVILIALDEGRLRKGLRGCFFFLSCVLLLVLVGQWLFHAICFLLMHGLVRELRFGVGVVLS